MSAPSASASASARFGDWVFLPFFVSFRSDLSRSPATPPVLSQEQANKQQLAWFGAAFWVVVFGVAFGGGKKEKPAAAAAPAAATA